MNSKISLFKVLLVSALLDLMSHSKLLTFLHNSKLIYILIYLSILSLQLPINFILINPSIDIIQLTRVFGTLELLPVTLADLRESCSNLNIPPPALLLEQYCSAGSDRQSYLTVEDIVSSTQVTSVGGTKRLSTFDYSSISHSSRPDFLSFRFDEAKLKTFVESKLPPLDFDSVLLDLTEQLTMLRSIIYSIKWVPEVGNDAVWNEKRIHCMMALFLNYTFATCNVEIKASAAGGGNDNRIVLNTTSHDGSSAVWNGFSDLKFSCDRSTNIEHATATLEMKVPFNTSSNSLYRSRAVQPKQQLLGQAMGLLQKSLLQKSGRPYNLSYLSDIFALSVMYHFENKAYLSERVTEVNAFCLRLLLICCGDLSPDEWNSLIPADTVTAALNDDDDTVSLASNNLSSLNPQDYHPVALTRPFTRSQKKGGGDHKGHVACGTFGCEEEEAHERRLADAADALRWEAKCDGFKYLGFYEMQQHNSIMS